MLPDVGYASILTFCRVVIMKLQLSSSKASLILSTTSSYLTVYAQGSLISQFWFIQLFQQTFLSNIIGNIDKLIKQMSKQNKQKVAAHSINTLNTNITQGLEQEEADKNLLGNLPSQMPQTLSHSSFNTKQLVQSNYEEGVYEQCKRLKMQNKSLRAVNKQLKKQLEDFSRRLDESLKKKDKSQKKYKIGQEIVQSMELRNAYKLCDIYKKEISFLKRRESQTRQGRIDQLENSNFELQRQKQKLLLQIKDLKKITKQQQKGLKQMAGPNAMKLLQQNEKLRQSLRRVQMLNDNKQQSASVKKSKQIVEQEKNQENEVETLRNKVIKSNRKVSLLMHENQKLKEYIEQLRGQLIQKNKDSMQIKQRMANLRKQNEQYRKRRIQTQPEILTKITQTNQESQRNFSSSRHLKLRTQFQVEGDRLNRHKKNSASLLTQKYPKMVQKGEKTQSGIKWNDHQFSSKIKQIQVSPHPLGHIKQLHFRYQKGESTSTLKKYASFCCEQNSGEYIKYIRGGFKNNLLRYLKVQTSKGRKSNFCEFQLEDQCTNFQFSCASNQFLGSFFGENTKQGICRLGCFIQLIK